MSRRRASRAAAAVLLLLLALELVCRAIGFGDPPLAVLDPDVEYYPKPGMAYRRFHNAVAINRYGMRSEDFDRGTLDPRHHVALFGDSVVYGNHFLDQRDTIAARLQAALRSRPGDAQAIVSAIASSSWGPKNLLEFDRKFGPFPARAAVVVLSSHDRADFPSFEPDIVPYRLSAPHSALWDAYLTLHERLWGRAEPRWPGMRYEDRVAATEQALDALLVRLRQHDGQVLLAFHPTQDELRAGGPGDAERYYAAKAQQQQVGFVSLREVYAAAAPGTALYKDAIHLAAPGAALVADALLQRLGPAAPR